MKILEMKLYHALEVEGITSKVGIKVKEHYNHYKVIATIKTRTFELFVRSDSALDIIDRHVIDFVNYLKSEI